MVGGNWSVVDTRTKFRSSTNVANRSPFGGVHSVSEWTSSSSSRHVYLYPAGMAVASQMVPLGTPAPDFSLDDVIGRTARLDDFDGAPALLVAFLCNHCPYVRHVEAELGRVLARHPSLAVVGICTNDADAYPEDRPERLAD